MTEQASLPHVNFLELLAIPTVPHVSTNTSQDWKDFESTNYNQEQVRHSHASKT